MWRVEDDAPSGGQGCSPIGSAGDLAAQDAVAGHPRAPEDGRAGLTLVEFPGNPARDRGERAAVDAGGGARDLRQLEDEPPLALADAVAAGNGFDGAALAA